MIRRASLVIGLVALAHAALYIVYQQGEWQSPTAWTDQRGYQRLGEVLATTGQFTRYADTDAFVPEVIRTPGYPAFVAAIYKVFGVGNNMAVAIAQAFVFAAICCDGVLHRAPRRRRSQRRSSPRAMTALYSPLPYFGSLILTELWTAFMATAAILVCLRAVQRGRLRDYVLAGALFSATTLVRPAFVLMPFFFAIAVPMLVRSAANAAPRSKAGRRSSIAAALALMPWFAYNYVNLGQITLSPAGGIGRGLWEGSWQGRWSGRLQAELTDLADVTTRSRRVDSPRHRQGPRQRTCPRRRCCNTSTSGATSARSGTRPPIRWSASAPASTPIANISRHAMANMQRRSDRSRQAPPDDRRVRAVGGGGADSIRAISTACRPGSFALMWIAAGGAAGCAPRRRCVWLARQRPLARGRDAGAADRLRDRCASAVAVRGAPIAAGQTCRASRSRAQSVLTCRRNEAS